MSKKKQKPKRDYQWIANADELLPDNFITRFFQKLFRVTKLLLQITLLGSIVPVILLFFLADLLNGNCLVCETEQIIFLAGWILVVSVLYTLFITDVYDLNYSDKPIWMLLFILLCILQFSAAIWASELIGSWFFSNAIPSFGLGMIQLFLPLLAAFYVIVGMAKIRPKSARMIFKK